MFLVQFSFHNCDWTHSTPYLITITFCNEFRLAPTLTSFSNEFDSRSQKFQTGCGSFLVKTISHFRTCYRWKKNAKKFLKSTSGAENELYKMDYRGVKKSSLILIEISTFWISNRYNRPQLLAQQLFFLKRKSLKLYHSRKMYSSSFFIPKVTWVENVSEKVKKLHSIFLL